MWTDRPFFQNTVNLVFGTLADKVPAEFIADREKLRGAKFDVAAMKAAIPQMRDQFRAHLQWIDAQLCDERPWIAGDAPSLCDVDAYMNIWYARASLDNAEYQLRALWELVQIRVNMGELAQALVLGRQLCELAATRGEAGDLLAAEGTVAHVLHLKGEHAEARHLLECRLERGIKRPSQSHFDRFVIDQGIAVANLLSPFATGQRVPQRQ